MFRSLKNIIKIDFSKFDTSQVTDMGCMFLGCDQLVSLDLSNFNTSSVERMESMFDDCKLLTSLNLNNFDTSNVITMQSMFWGCKGLTSLDLSNFITSKVTNMKSMFNSCTGLLSLNLDNFDTSLVNNMDTMFKSCSSLKSLNLYNFDTTNIYTYNDIFLGCDALSSYCINKEKNSNLAVLLNNDLYNCSVFSYYEEEEIEEEIEEKEDIEEEIEKEKEETEEKDEEEKDEEEKVENEGEGVEEKSIEEQEEEEEKKNVEIDLEEIEKEKNEDIKEEKENSEEIKKEKEIEKDNKKMFDDFKDCSTIDLFNGNFKINNITSLERKNELIYKIESDLKEGKLDNLLSKLVEGDKKDLKFQNGDTVYIISTTNNQNNKIYDNVSLIKLGECENKLRNTYTNINKDEPLLIFKIDYFEEGLLIPIVEYDIYSYKNKTKLNLSVCNDTKIKILYPALIDEKNEFKHNPSNDYYNNLCHTYTTENGTDIILEDRKQDYKKNNYSLCESKCDYEGFNSSINMSQCNCEIKIRIHLFTEIVLDKNKLLDSFINIKQITNLNVVKCYNIFFTKEGIKANIGSFIVLLIIFIFICSFIFFILKGFSLLCDLIDRIVQNKQYINQKRTNKRRKNKGIMNIKKNKNNLKNNGIISIKKYMKKKTKNLNHKNIMKNNGGDL